MLKLFEHQYKMKLYFQALRATKQLGIENFKSGFSKKEMSLIDNLIKNEPVNLQEFELDELSSVISFFSVFEFDTVYLWENVELPVFLPKFWQVYKKYSFDFQKIKIEHIRFYFQALKETDNLGVNAFEDGFSKEELYLLNCLVKEEPVDFSQIEMEHIATIANFVAHFDSDVISNWERVNFSVFLPCFWQAFDIHGLDFTGIHSSQLNLTSTFLRKYQLGIAIETYVETYLDKVNHYENYDHHEYISWANDILDEKNHCDNFIEMVPGMDMEAEKEILNDFSELFEMPVEEIENAIDEGDCRGLEIISNVSLQDPSKIIVDGETSIRYAKSSNELYIYYGGWFNAEERLHMILNLLECIKEEREQHENSNNN